MPMLLWLLLLILSEQMDYNGTRASVPKAPRREQSGVAPKAVLLLDPPWSTAFKGEKVTLTCRRISHSPARRDTFWYRDEKFWKTQHNAIQIRESGNYQCRTRGSSLSDAVHVEFSHDSLILQASHPVFEGDNVTLRCQGKENEKAREKVYYKDGKQLPNSYNLDFITVNSVSRDNSKYHCTATCTILSIVSIKRNSKPLNIQVQELFPHPVLRVSSSTPIEGSPMTLICETQLSPQRPEVQLQFSFFRDSQTLGSGWSTSPELQIPAMWTEDSGSYWCETETVTHNINKRSLTSQIRVQRVPVSNVNLEIQPTGGQLIEGESMVLICSVAQGSGTVTFSWHKEGRVRSLGRKTQRSLLAELHVLMVKESDAGRYYCAADNVHGPILSRWIQVTVRIPVSHPILTFRAPRVQALVGDLLELHCESLRGSPPILYRFYHEDVTLGNSSATSGGGAFFNLSLTAEHSGNYSCDADNGLGAQHSHGVSLRVTVPVSRPILTLRAPGAQAVVGDLLELHCESLRGSFPILYWFYHEDDTLGKSSAHSGGGASFNLSLTTEHSGNYSCEADNGLGAQRSEVVTFSVTGTSRNRTGLTTAGVTGLVLSILSLAAAAAALLHYARAQRKPGGLSATGTSSHSPSECQEPSLSRPSRIDLQEPTHSKPLAPVELEPMYSNVNPGDSNLIYSHIWSIQHTKENSANCPTMHQEHKELTVLYSELKKKYPDDSAGEARSRGRAHEDDEENYENMPHVLLASDH
ncbi:PREDICTED: Fc receptor-like protein 3 isoform X1 [Cercocebus atys]|uniref:Fc receptor like 3 n=1 Tax=Cercocebus atys TaxID=9531 RepID=A0A2K5M880_CERAT|nr:PREDICTED: Fc receptor-like protein 3 isoform X1 [Cercocebus atys]XP_011934193.1 PREDICTED: Fc receptor-like protein 3 isoform X1 [Cercocebus atys]